MNKKLLVSLWFLIVSGLVYADAPIEDYSMNNSNSPVANSMTNSNSSVSASNSTWQEIKAENNTSASNASSNSNSNISSNFSTQAVNSQSIVNPVNQGINTSKLSLEQRVARLEQQINYLNNSNLPAQMEKIQQQLQSLNGTTETQQHKIDEIKQQVEQFYNDLDQRLNELKSVPQTKTSSVKAGADIKTKQETKSEVKTKTDNKALKTVSENSKTTQKNIDNKPSNANKDTKDTSKDVNKSSNKTTKTVNTQTKNEDQRNNAKDDENSPSDNDQPLQIKEQKMYQSALDDLRNKNFTNGSQKLEQYIKAYPNGLYTANAHYWLGEIYLLRGTYDKSLAEFNVINSKYASSPKVADALFKIAFIHEKQGKKDLAIKEYKDLQKRYPHSSASKLAEQQLK